MQDMYERLGLRCGRTDGKFGVEIEVEGANLPTRYEDPIFDAFWKVERDGSLKGKFDNLEYVMRKPLSLDGVKDSVAALERRYQEKGSVVDETVRAGVHVHLNIQNYSPLELMTFATTYYMLEDYFVHWSGVGRVGNHFCLRATDAEGVIYKLIDACEKRDWRHLNTDDIRYASLNWNAMHKYGSIEFRSMRSTRKLEDVIRWVELIDRLTVGAKQFNNPREVIGAVSEFQGPERFIEFVMGDCAREFLQFRNVDIWEGLRNVQPLAFLIEWEKFNKMKVNPFV
jgi:hypothetical protein